MIYNPATVRDHFTLAAARYDEFALLQQAVLKYGMAIAASFLPAQARMLDAGCGTGLLARYALEAHPNWHITAADIAHGMCQTARMYPNKHIVNANVEALPFAGESFDGILCSLVMQWVNTRKNAWAEMARVLKSGGHAVIASFGPETLHELRTSFAALDGWPHISQFASSNTFAHEAKAAGLMVEHVESKQLQETYPSTQAIMRTLKKIGAANKRADRKRGLSTPAQFAKVEQEYAARYGNTHGLPVTWDIYYLAVRKP